MLPQLQILLKSLHLWKNGHAPQKISGTNGKHSAPENEPSQPEVGPLLPYMIFRDKTCVPVTRMEEDNLLIFHPKDNTLLRSFLGQEDSHGFFLSPKLTSPELFAGKPLQSYNQALCDPLLRTLPYVLETYRVLESTYRRPAYRLMEPAGRPDEGYLLKYNCDDAFGTVSGQITCRVLFFQNRVLFTSPVLTHSHG